MGVGDAVQHDPIPLYDGVAPGSEGWTHEQRDFHSEIFDTRVITNVVVPTLTPVLAQDGTGTAVIVAPGGGYHALSIDSEGFDAARWPAERGVAAFVLAYRLFPTGADGPGELVEKMLDGPDPTSLEEIETIVSLAAADGRTAVRLVREHADEFGVDPTRVGFMGFSAGGDVAIRVAYADDADDRPNFIVPVYPPVRGRELGAPPDGSGPLFVVAATDDALGLAGDAIEIYETWRRAGLPAEVHMYGSGGHGFGMKTQGLPSDTWIDRLGDWLRAAGLMEG